MDIILSKVLPQIIFPLNISMLLIIVSIYFILRKRKRMALTLNFTALTILWIFSTPQVSRMLLSNIEGKFSPIPMEEIRQADAIVILGGSIGLPLPPRLYPDLNGAADRVLYGAQLYLEKKSPLIIVSGGNVFPQKAMSEGEYTKSLLVMLGVEEKDIIVEGNSRNTYENAIETAKILKEKNLNKILLVTSAMHMPRAFTTFQSFGINAIATPTDFNIVAYSQPGILEWIPNVYAQAASTQAMREMLGSAVYKLRTLIK